MRQKLLILLIFAVSYSFAQVEKIKIKKEESLSKKPIVTLAGIQNGEVSLTKLCSDRKFKILNNSDSLKVEFGIIQFLTNDGTLTEWVNSSYSLSNPFLQFLLGPLSAPKTKVTIYNIKGKNNKGKETKLNDITVTVVK